MFFHKKVIECFIEYLTAEQRTDELQRIKYFVIIYFMLDILLFNSNIHKSVFFRQKQMILGKAGFSGHAQRTWFYRFK